MDGKIYTGVLAVQTTDRGNPRSGKLHAQIELTLALKWVTNLAVESGPQELGESSPGVALPTGGGRHFTGKVFYSRPCAHSPS